MKLLLATSVAVALFIGVVSESDAKKAKHQSYIVRGLMCIHSFEGAWNDPNGPYWGGLQMDLSFQSTHGWIKKGPQHHKWSFLKHWGTADKWPVWGQVLAGIHGYFSRGWNPWPNTAHSCGLI